MTDSSVSTSSRLLSTGAGAGAAGGAGTFGSRRLLVLGFASTIDANTKMLNVRTQNLIYFSLCKNTKRSTWRSPHSKSLILLASEWKVFCRQNYQIGPV